MTRRLLALCLIAGALSAPAHAGADADAEREALARITHELDRVQELVRAAARQADPAARVRFEYALLARDIELIKRGVDEHLDAPRQPRPVAPLSGDYRR